MYAVAVATSVHTKATLSYNATKPPNTDKLAFIWNQMSSLSPEIKLEVQDKTVPKVRGPYYTEKTKWIPSIVFKNNHFNCRASIELRILALT